MLQQTPLWDDKWTWIAANVPKQGWCTNDCGVIASCFSLLYVRGLEDVGLLSENDAVESFQQVQSVTLQLPEEMLMADFGFLGRQFMTKSTKVATFDCFKGNLFEAKVLWN
jgi:hypothetical protein